METCDVCGFRAIVTTARDGATLTFCGHHYWDRAEALYAAGWRLGTIELIDSKLHPAFVEVPA